MRDQGQKQQNTSADMQVEDLHAIDEGAQRGTNRGPHVVPNARGNRNVVPAQAAFEGSISTRTPDGDGQGITSHSQREENARQAKVVKDRPDAVASLNHGKVAG